MLHRSKVVRPLLSLILAATAACSSGSAGAPSPSAPRPARTDRGTRTGPAETPRRMPALPVPAEPPAGAPPGRLTAVERGIIDEMNLARRDPAGYARLIEARLPHYDGKALRLPGFLVLRTEEGARAAEEAIAALRAQRPLAPLSASSGMTTGARDHVRDQGPKGVVGHEGTDGSTFDVRAGRYGRWGISLTENISYGPTTARDVVIDLIVDDGVRDRGHRHNIFDPLARVVGVACGRHATYGYMCVMDFAGSYAEGPPSAQSAPAPNGRPRP